MPTKSRRTAKLPARHVPYQRPAPKGVAPNLQGELVAGNYRTPVDHARALERSGYLVELANADCAIAPQLGSDQWVVCDEHVYRRSRVAHPRFVGENPDDPTHYVITGQGANDVATFIYVCPLEELHELRDAAADAVTRRAEARTAALAARPAEPVTWLMVQKATANAGPRDDRTVADAIAFLQRNGAHLDLEGGNGIAVTIPTGTDISTPERHQVILAAAIVCRAEAVVADCLRNRKPYPDRRVGPTGRLV